MSWNLFVCLFTYKLVGLVVLLSPSTLASCLLVYYPPSSLVLLVYLSTDLSSSTAGPT